MSESTKVILPGGTIGMVGGGQLGRMFAMAAASMGYRVVVFCESRDEPAPQVAHECVVGKLDDMQAVEKFASRCDVITLEFENIPASTIAACQRFAPTYPSANVLATAQDRLREKSTLQNAGLPVAPFAEVNDFDSLVVASERVGLPLILKTARSGYDGKGQHRIETIEDAKQVDWASCDRWVAEQLICFDREVSVIVARSSDGRTASFPIFENEHTNHILDISMVPAAVSKKVQNQARSIAVSAAETMDVVGLLCVEMFVESDTVLINEVAPRPHNSGHLTIEACHTSQFAQHVRAICGLPLGKTNLVSRAAAMANLLGDVWGSDCESPPAWDQAIAVEGVCLHLYGKQEAKMGRKMGHLTCVGEDRSRVVRSVVEARQRLV
ncbi:5-(carboxyamino)imidazole ribonucleotide synthase [Novipirellula artificiosorum]|uniref:N5-carboxyaminoimidazole ribonucleotide synthase n=1 Tax=Novipirellula artificiosorum TaxID=2528016 RepID=A0A5C6E2A9_9BACT|nr:5-(carboxyamino)imidazole ribonucleotide synthase [Novipirellula artificiosorum]TWU42624.1 N5-carboxyaminoimidazole ribonucleotide synthase [Novipirellula artificiosorum]